MSKKNEDDEIIVWDKVSKRWISIAVLMTVFALLSPLIFTQDWSFVSFKETGTIGDTIGGIMNPFISIGVGILTFLAFYMQMQANATQRILFKKEFKEQRIQFMKTLFENQFYEMLRLHRSNVDELSVTFSDPETYKPQDLTGRSVFEHLKNEIEMYLTFGNSANLISDAYKLFFDGIGVLDENNEFKTNYNAASEAYRQGTQEWESYVSKNNISQPIKVNSNQEINRGHANQLGHYYRHIYQTVKFVAKQNEEFISCEEKQNYLTILRAQLSNDEQVLLFYNWKSGYGSKWEDDKHNFFSQYKMIHNVYPSMVHQLFDLKTIFQSQLKKYPDMFDFNQE